jgi:P-type Ca2+ transporter type 2C
MQDKKWYSISKEDVLNQLESSNKGISASQAQQLLKKKGYNELKEKKKRSLLHIFASQFENMLVILLMVAIIISIFVGAMIDAAVIAVIVIVNGLLGFVQEYRAEKAIEALKKLSAPHAIVIRDGIEQKIDAKELVIGDIILFEEGARIPADARLLEEFSLQIDESTLTGESAPVNKELKVLAEKSAVADRKNMIFMNTNVTRGRGRAIVVATGMDTQVGNIAGMIQAVEEKDTPLQKKLAAVGKSIGIAVIFIAVAIFGLGIFRGGEVFDMLITAIALAVAAVPEGLPAVVTITLALGLTRMSKAKALIRKLPAVETLGATTVICSDKTGTLTRNEMTVDKVFTSNKFFSVSGVGYNPFGGFTFGRKNINPKKNKNLSLTLLAATLCTTAKLVKSKKWKIFGDPTEGALIVVAHKAGLIKDKLLNHYKHIAEIPFDSKRKMMSVCYVTPTRKKTAYVKGAPEILLDKCTRIFKDGRVTKITAADRKKILAANNKMAESALRVLGIAYRVLPATTKKFDSKNIEKDLVFLGLQGMLDPPRIEVKTAIETCKKAGIKSIMITGDHEVTARAIAKELGILDGGEVLTGQKLDKISDTELRSKVKGVYVYARVSPEHKVRILTALQKNGEIVAMTGDGVNDAPALKNADIGIAMGLVGTDVAKEASAMVLQDDNFATIVSAVREGRGIYDNIKNFIRYLLSSNVGEVMVIFAAALIGLPLPLIAVQLLWMNLLTDGVPALALGIDPPARDIMNRLPRNPKEHTIDRNMWVFIFIVGIVMMVGTIGVFSHYLSTSLEHARTMAFTTIVMFQMWNVFNSRTEESIFSKSFWNNRWLLVAIASSIILQFMVVYVPWFQQWFSTIAIGPIDWLWVIIVSFSVIIVIEAKKKLLKTQFH